MIEEGFETLEVFAGDTGGDLFGGGDVVAVFQRLYVAEDADVGGCGNA